MLHIGYHESSSDGYMAMGNEAVSVGADTFAFFTRNPRGGAAKPLDKADAASFCTFAREHAFAPLVAHAPYTMNPCAADPGLRDFARNMMIDDLNRLSYTPGNLYNFHPGSHVKQGADVGIALTADMLAAVFRAVSDISTTVLIETMAGKGSEIGRTFEEVRAIIDRAEQSFGKPLDGRLGVCLDTCHVWDGGYDIVNDLDGVITQFDKVIGLERLKAVHLNDSMNVLGAHKDRHQKIGQGEIGLEALVRVINHAALKDKPFILETPNERAGYISEIALLKSRVQ
ncbi:MAG: deoxyribonuclease IV [Treponema sp.]|nr:deoxyribonuclease IV [Candidatus Treponema caballi]